jgi:hypothetical protein
MDDFGPFADLRRAFGLMESLQLGDTLPPVGAGAEQQQLRGIRRQANGAAQRAASPLVRRAGAAVSADGVNMPSPVAWPKVAAPANSAYVAEPVRLPPSPISTSPAGWDGEPSLHQPLGSRWS